MFLIDGYNLLRSVQGLSDMTADITDAQVCKLISRYLGITKRSGAVIFDGIGPRDKSIFNNMGALEIIFSGRTKEADDIIEKIIRENSAPKNLTIISCDRRIKDAAHRRKSETIDSPDFWLEMLKTIEKKSKRKNEPPAKFLGISDCETEYWLKVFGLLK